MKLILVSLFIIFNITNVLAQDSQNNLYNQIYDELKIQYQSIGLNQAQNILVNNQLALSAGYNNVGLSYHRPFGNFSIEINRGLAPDLFDDQRWIVTDQLTITIDAAKIMQDQTVFNIDASALNAFIGVSFKRTFTWIHFAKSYKEGLTTHFEKLFFPFMSFDLKTIATLPENEMITKEDSLSFSGGGTVSIPIYPGFGASAGIFGRYQKMSRFEAIAMPNNHLQLSLEKSSLESIDFALSVEAMFFKVIKLTLLSYDFEYEHDSSIKLFTDFNQSDLINMDKNSDLALQVKHVINNSSIDQTILAPYLISEEKKNTEKMKSKYSFLLWGGNKSSETQQIEITTNGHVETFFHHSYEKIIYSENILSKLLASIAFGLTQNSILISKLSTETKKVEIEYHSDKNLIDAHESINITPDSQTLSLRFSGEFMTKKTTGISGKHLKARALNAMANYTGVDPMISQMIETNEIKAPLLIQGTYQITTEGIKFLNSLSTSEVFDTINDLCGGNPCRRSLQNDYIDYLKDLSHEKMTIDFIDRCERSAMKHIFWSFSKKRMAIKNCLSEVSFKPNSAWTDIPLWSLKNFSQNLVSNINNKIHYYNLFGIQNVFFYGTVQAVTNDGNSFITSFHEGAFSDFGAVDNLLRAENIRAPGSVIQNN